MDSVISWVCLTIFGLAAIASFLREVIRYEIEKQARSEQEFERVAEAMREEDFREFHFNEEYRENLNNRQRCLF